MINPYKPQKPSLLEAEKEIKLSGLFNEEDVKNLIKEFFFRNKGIKINDIDRKTLYNWIQKGRKSNRGKFKDFYLNSIEKWKKSGSGDE